MMLVDNNEPFCACGRRKSECDGSRRGCLPDISAEVAEFVVAARAARQNAPGLLWASPVCGPGRLSAPRPRTSGV